MIIINIHAIFYYRAETLSDYDYFKICKTCGINCCKELFAFVAEYEIPRIQEHLKKVSHNKSKKSTQ